MVSINDICDIVADVAGVLVKKKHIPGPEGVRGRNSDNSRIKEVLNWAPSVMLKDGIQKTYPWIRSQIEKEQSTEDIAQVARKRKDNKKWCARPSRQKSHRKKKATQKPSKIRKNNSKVSRSTKPSQQRRRKNDDSAPLISLETQSTEEVFDTRIIHNFLSERYLSEVRQVWPSCQCCMCEHPECNMQPAKKEHEEYHDCVVDDMICLFCYDFISKENTPFCPHSHTRNMMSIPISPTCLKLGFLEQQAVALMHCYMSILIIRGHQSAMKGQVVHCQANIADNIGNLLPLPKCYEFMAVIQQKPSNDNNEIRST
ncbi:unnamed protein product, partial [Adineta steineri]